MSGQEDPCKVLHNTLERKKNRLWLGGDPEHNNGPCSGVATGDHGGQ